MKRTLGTATWLSHLAVRVAGAPVTGSPGQRPDRRARRLGKAFRFAASAYCCPGLPIHFKTLVVLRY